MFEESMNIDSLMVVHEVKSKVKDYLEFLVKNSDRNKALKIEGGLFYNLCISGNKGCGKSSIVKNIVDLIFSKEILKENGFFDFKLTDLYSNHPLLRSTGECTSGVIIIDCAIDNRRSYEENILTLERIIKKHRKNFIFILQGNKKEINIIKGNIRIKNSIHFNIDIEDFSNEEVLDIVTSISKKEGYKIEDEAKEVILEQVKYIKEEKQFENIYTAEQIMNNAIINKLLCGPKDILTKEDFRFEKVDKQEIIEEIKNDNIINPINELENLIGLGEVKARVKEIINFVQLQNKRRELGMKEERVCLHMCFTGAPGTGKTTVARIIGEILKNLNILSKGHMVEVTREGLCGKFVGHTAAMTKEKIEAAKGGVLFIDEAYSLVSKSGVDYGKEALNTLVKYMEEYRDDLVVIFAGYSNEMEELLNMNVGLRSRVGFNIEFESYSTKELCDIWVKFCKDSNYLLSADAIDKMMDICKVLGSSDYLEEGNGRSVRKCYEKSKLIQATRVVQNNLTAMEDIITITEEDIVELYKELRFKKKATDKKRNIGFCI